MEPFAYIRGMPKDKLKELRSRVRAAMKARKWEPVDLCREAGLPKATVSRFLNARNKGIDYATANKLENAIAL